MQERLSGCRKESPQDSSWGKKGMYLPRQTTIAHSFSIAGKGIHMGRSCTLTFSPAPVGTGIAFQRIDLPQQPIIAARPGNVRSTKRCTCIGWGEAEVSTVEHVMAALRGMEVDNCLLIVDGPEVPIADGSAAVFSKKLKETGIVEQDAPRRYLELSHPVWVSDGDRHMVALPSQDLRISFTFTNDWGHAKLSDQFAEFAVTPEVFESEIAPARTIGWLAEVEALQRQGLVKGGSIDIAVVMSEDDIITPLRFPNEPVRHKILDTIGDLALLGFLRAHVICVRGGHQMNALLGQAIWQVANSGCTAPVSQNSPR